AMSANFTEVVDSNIISATASDLSSFDTNCWTITKSGDNKRIAWTGTADTAVSSVGSVTVENKKLAKNGTTEYAIVLPDGADATLTTAKDELITLFAEATGATLAVVDDSAYDTYGAYISIGNTQMFSASGVEMGEMNSQGYHLQTVNNTIYINGESSRGCLYGVYGLLKELFEFEQYSADTYALQKSATVELLTLNKTESPDFTGRVPSNGALEGDSDYANRMGLANERYIIPAGDYRLQEYGGKWANYHNALEVLPPSYWIDVEGKSNWFSDDETQLCYTAHGNTDDYNAMVAQIVDVMTLSLSTETYGRAKYPEATYITLTSEDTVTSCACDACVEAKTLYGSEAGAVIKLCNDVRAGLETWMNENTQWKRELYLLFFAYNNYVDAPTVTLNETTGKYEMAGGLEMRSDVGVYYAVSNYVNYYFDIYNTANDTFRAQFDAWAKITQVNDSPFCLWTYSKNFSMYMLRADVYGEGKFYNENAYSYFANAGVDLYWNQGASNGTTTLSTFEKLNGYIDSQMMWDSTQSVTTLTDNWFAAMYGAGADSMKSLYNAQNDAARSVFGTTKLGIPSVVIGGSKSTVRKTLTSSVFTTWFGYITSAKDAVNADGSLTDAEKAKMIEHINEEWISVEFLYVWLYYSKTINGLYGVTINVSETQAAFREVLGYDSSTGTYAKDVVLLEKADCTLVEYIESGFTKSV
ncbi:MAG: DUF4838 domain-containing protein, partial [Clostridia bacterium]|nr:DUF4838 domain-containing protein [Clostridia bacterium]